MTGRKIRRLRLAAGSAVALLVAASAFGAEWRLPKELDDKLAALPEEHQTFIASGAFRDFMPARQIEHELATRDAAAMQQLVGDLLAVAAQMGYDPGRDMGAIPLNLTSREFNQGTIPTPAPLRKIARSPGPFSVHRYLFPESGVPTFAQAKVAIWPEDLVAGKVDVAIIGVPNDMSSGRRNAGYGPRVLRAVRSIATPDADTLIDPTQVLSVVDYGDFSIDNMSTARSVAHVTRMVAETAATGAVPMLVGGDTSMLYPGVKGVAEVHGAGTFGLVHFSAHPDADRFAVHTISDQQAMFLLLDESIVRGNATIQVGLRGPAVDASTLEWLRSQGVRYHTMAAIRRQGYDAVLKRVLQEVRRGPDGWFVSVDVSVIEPAEMVAAGRLAANGLRVQELARAIRHVCAAKDVVGFQITDLSPMLDFSRLSAENAATVMNACLVGMAVRRSGLAPDYIHPLVLNHGQR